MTALAAGPVVWFDCASDDPPIPGYYPVLFLGEPEDTESPLRMYWDGDMWKCHQNSTHPASFGNFDCEGERWGGFATPIGGLYV